MVKLAIDRASIFSCKKKSGDRGMFIILSKIGRSPAKSGDLEALTSYVVTMYAANEPCFNIADFIHDTNGRCQAIHNFSTLSLNCRSLPNTRVQSKVIELPNLTA